MRVREAEQRVQSYLRTRHPVRFVDCLSLCGFFDFRLLILCYDMVWTDVDGMVQHKRRRDDLSLVLRDL